MDMCRGPFLLRLYPILARYGLFPGFREMSQSQSLDNFFFHLHVTHQ